MRHRPQFRSVVVESQLRLGAAATARRSASLGVNRRHAWFGVRRLPARVIGARQSISRCAPQRPRATSLRSVHGWWWGSVWLRPLRCIHLGRCRSHRHRRRALHHRRARNCVRASTSSANTNHVHAQRVSNGVVHAAAPLGRWRSSNRDQLARGLSRAGARTWRGYRVHHGEGAGTSEPR